MKQNKKQLWSLVLIIALALPQAGFAQNNGITQQQHEANKTQIAGFANNFNAMLSVYIPSFLGYIYISEHFETKRLAKKALDVDNIRYSDYELIQDKDRLTHYLEKKITGENIDVSFKGVDQIFDEIRPYIVSMDNESKTVTIKVDSQSTKALRLNRQELAGVVQTFQFVHPDLTKVYIDGLVTHGYTNYVEKLTPEAVDFLESRGVFIFQSTQQRFKDLKSEFVSNGLRSNRGTRRLFATCVGIASILVVVILEKLSKGSLVQFKDITSPEDLASLAKNDYPAFEAILDESPELTQQLTDVIRQVPAAKAKIVQFDKWIAGTM